MFTDKLSTGAFVDSDKCHNRGTIVCKGNLTDKDFRDFLKGHLKRTFEENCSQQYQMYFSVVSDFCCDRGKESCNIRRSELVFTASAEV